MEKNLNRKYGLFRTLVSCLLLTWATVAMAGVAPLDNQESDGYLQWFHSLEHTVAAREAAGTEEGNLLYPFGYPGWKGQQHRPYRHLTISKAIMELEAQWQLRGENREESALVALAHARNYTNLSEFDSAMVWYEAAADLDTMSLFRREIGRERLAVASAIGDSLTMSQLITNTLGSVDLNGREKELILAYRWLLIQRDSEALTLLLDKVESQPEIMNNQLLFWHSFSESWLERRSACLVNLRKLVRIGGLSEGLTERQRAWVLVAIPDLMFLLGAPDQARPLYEALKDSKMNELSIWSRYQLANLDFLAGDYEKAAGGFSLVCDAPRQGSWQDQACSMSDIAHELERIRSEGEPYGIAQFYNP